MIHHKNSSCIREIAIHSMKFREKKISLCSLGFVVINFSFTEAPSARYIFFFSLNSWNPTVLVISLKVSRWFVCKVRLNSLLLFKSLVI